VLVLVIVVLASQVSACYATDRSGALTQIDNAQIGMQTAFQTVRYFWPNASEAARANATADLARSFDFIRQAEQAADAGVYNSSYQSGVFGEFYAVRATYRMVLDVTYSAIQSANQTLMAIPKEIGKPPEAIELLGNATAIYKNAFYPSMLQVGIAGSGISIDSSSRIAANTLQTAIQVLYYSTGSAYSYASKALHFINEYISEQETARSFQTHLYQSQLVLLILFVLAFCVVTVWYTTRKALERGAIVIGRRLRGFGLRILGIMGKCADQKNLDIMLRTTGTLLSTVIALVAIVYFLSSIYASEGLRINLQFVSSTFGGFLLPAALLTSALIFGLFALTLSTKGDHIWRSAFASIGFYLFFLGGAFFVLTVYQLLVAIG
jgi:hypothetical protein